MAVEPSPLAFYDSLVKKKKIFEYNGPTVTWYCCGPTVYGPAHLGHARNYVGNDYIRRIMKYYFKLPIRMVLNITDVDDKIIRLARTEYLYGRFKEQPSPKQIEVANAAIAHARSRNAVVPFQNVTEADLSNPDLELVVGPYLDAVEGNTIDFKHEIFLRVTQHFEHEYFEDMRQLNVIDPDKIVRVSESMDQIVSFIEQICAKGFGYETPDHSIYFDIAAFESAGHCYARLEPSSRSNKALQEEGEGHLTTKTTKRSDGDFALWKASKPGEPSWPSRWGPGRPGWHIECSAMACAEFGETLDIHSGGIDLAFPHHDNELAQSEAYWSTQDASTGKAKDAPWVQHFIHMGHLNIKGAKMSKSLKNFISIREALARDDYTPRSLRTVFLSSSWRDSFEVSDGAIEWASNWENTVDVLFVLAQNLTWQKGGSTTSSNGTAELTEEKSDALAAALRATQDEVDAALRDSFNTRATLESIARLINMMNATIQQSATGPQQNAEQIIAIAKYVTFVVQIFGLVPGIEQPQDGTLGWAGTSIPESDLPAIKTIADLRHAIRSIATSVKAGEDPAESFKALNLEASEKESQIVGTRWEPVIEGIKSTVSDIHQRKGEAREYLSLADRIRDQILWDAGYYLEDTVFQSPAYLMRPVRRADRLARSESEARAQAKEAAKAKRAEEAARKAAEEAEKAKIDPAAMFKTQEFSAWDEATGLPTKKANGDEVPKSQLKKLKKEQDVQRKLYEKFQDLNMKTGGS